MNRSSSYCCRNSLLRHFLQVGIRHFVLSSWYAIFIGKLLKQTTDGIQLSNKLLKKAYS